MAIHMTAPQGATGSGIEWHSYYFNGTDDGSENDDIAIEVPTGARWFSVRGNANAVALGVFATATAGVEANDNRVDLAASANEPMRPCRPGTFICLSNQDGTSAVGVFYLAFEGGDLPNKDALSISDPGAA